MIFQLNQYQNKISSMKNLFFLSLICLFISSCGTQKKLEAIRKGLNEVKEGQAIESAKITTISNFSVSKINEGKIESRIKSLIDRKLKGYFENLDSAGKSADIITNLLDYKKAFRKNYKTIIVPTLDTLQKNNSLLSQRMVIYNMIEDGLNIADYHLFELAAFFGSGVFTIPTEKTELAHTLFSPIVDSLKYFSNKYAEIPRTASLVVLGFADGTGFSEGPLFDTLTSLIGNKEADKKDLNQKLSELRANELIKQLQAIFLKKETEFKNPDNLDVKYFGTGKGEAFPLPTIKDYQTEDDRRRIVLCYWVVLPK